MKGNDHGKKMDLVGVCGMTVCIIYIYVYDRCYTNHLNTRIFYVQDLAPGKVRVCFVGDG